MVPRSPYGLWLDVHSVSRPSGPSGVTTIPRVSIGTPWMRASPRVASTTTSARAKAASGSSTFAVERPATLSGQSPNTRAASGASAASSVPAAGRGS